jgi:hypothetical protein
MPATPKAADAAEAQAKAAIEQAQLSGQAQFSTYSKDDDPAIDKDANPPDGPHLKQERGKPREGPVKAFGAS